MLTQRHEALSLLQLYLFYPAFFFILTSFDDKELLIDRNAPAYAVIVCRADNGDIAVVVPVVGFFAERWRVVVRFSDTHDIAYHFNDFMLDPLEHNRVWIGAHDDMVELAVMLNEKL